MKLVEILARDLAEWPDQLGAMGISQDGDRSLNRLDYGVHVDDAAKPWPDCGTWPSSTWTRFSLLIPNARASDYRAAIVTRAQWEAEKMKQAKPKEEIIAWEDMKEGMTVRCLDVVAQRKHWKFTVGSIYEVKSDCGAVGPADDEGDVPSDNFGFTFALVSDTQAKPAEQGNKWIRHRDGKCPVEAGVMVDVRYRGAKPGVDGYSPNGKKAGLYHWRHDSGRGDIMAWRIHKPERQQISDDDVIDLCVACADEPDNAVFQDCNDPRTIRDRITEIDTTVESLEEDRASLIQRLEDEGFKLIYQFNAKIAEAKQAHEGMDDWRNWQVGDLILRISESSKYYTKGETYEVERTGVGSVWLSDDDRGNHGWSGDSVIAENFKFHSQP